MKCDTCDGTPCEDMYRILHETRDKAECVKCTLVLVYPAEEEG